MSESRPPDDAHEHGPVQSESQPADAEPALVDALPAEPPVVYPFNAPLVALAGSAAPATRNANLSPAACRALVQKKKLPVKRDGRPTPGVATALRFTGPVHGVTFLTAGWKSPFGVMDCRLVLAFDELAELLAQHDVTQVHVGTIYRKNSKLGRNKLSQHAHGLAADIVAFKLGDGRLLDVERDFAGELGTPVCGPDSRLVGETAEAVALRNLVCDVARSGLFHYMLTPNHDQAHHDHLHVDIKRNATRTVIR
ncbi:MAG TPA: extensin family protein [Polyangiaceae bacterium]|nr:extensin family protein [Polyangiaceae bacterium]